MTIDVVYLAYFSQENGYNLKTVENFLSSYQQFAAGIEHSLVVIAKNLPDKASYDKLFQLAQENNAQIIDLPDDGWDIGAYFRASKHLNGDYTLFLGSSSSILCDNWLVKLYKPFESEKNVGLVGSMGSWETGITGLFPNPHIRTCSFMLKRNLFLEYIKNHKFPITKDDTYEIEHGKTSITRFVLNQGLNAVVVNADGEIFTHDKWFFSKTYRYPNECKAIISDKQLNLYFTSDLNRKLFLENLAWGIRRQSTRPAAEKVTATQQYYTSPFEKVSSNIAEEKKSQTKTAL